MSISASAINISRYITNNTQLDDQGKPGPLGPDFGNYLYAFISSIALSILYYNFCRYASALDGDPGENTYLESPGFQVPACVTFSFSMFVSSRVS